MYVNNLIKIRGSLLPDGDNEMACKFYEEVLDVCGLCDLRSDLFDESYNPSGQVDDVCQDAENISCTEFEEED